MSVCASHMCVGGGGGGGGTRAREGTGVVALPPLRPLKPRTFGIITMQLALHGSLPTPRKTNAALLRESELKFGVKHCVSCSKSKQTSKELCHTVRMMIAISCHLHSHPDKTGLDLDETALPTGKMKQKRKP